MSQIVEVVVPSLGEDVATVTLVAWLVDVGGETVEGDPLFEVETDKAVFEVEAETAGILAEVLVPAGGVVAQGATVARIRVG
jgi:pyruvate/2-oxoglutarate dehydrogenase complex dihydrolipoamide acyltransferase (E2) component